jgi:hypothetical protein
LAAPRALAEQQQARAIEFLPVRQAQVLQQLRQGGLPRELRSLAPAALEVGVERLLVEVGHRGARHRYHVRIHQPGALEQALDLLAHGDVPLVRTALAPVLTAFRCLS